MIPPSLVTEDLTIRFGGHVAVDSVSCAFRPGELTVIPFGTLPDRGKLDHYASLGIHETVLRLPSAGRDEVLRTLDEYAPFLDR